LLRSRSCSCYQFPKFPCRCLTSPLLIEPGGQSIYCGSISWISYRFHSADTESSTSCRAATRVTKPAATRCST
jgi:hypothetical protein